jgi:hypothetical protein
MPVADGGKYLVGSPAYEVVPAVETSGRIRAMTLMSNNLIPGSNMYVEAGWIVGMPDPNPHIGEHVHDYDEIVMHVGTDPDDQEDLGAVIEFFVDGEPLTISKTSSVFVPKGVKHGPLIWKSFSRPHIEMTVMIGAGTGGPIPAGTERYRGGRRCPSMRQYILTENPHAQSQVRMEEQSGKARSSAGRYCSHGSSLRCSLFVGCEIYGPPRQTGGHQMPHTHDFARSSVWGRHRTILASWAEIEFLMGGERHTITKTCLIFVPKGVEHCPITLKRIDTPIFMFEAANDPNYVKLFEPHTEAGG